ncbi:MAG TPA: prepilin-type N-terminal cleavage/methylation domain-containing protein [Lysobacter sp.]
MTAAIRRRQRAPRRALGFSMIELMISMVLGLVVIGAAVAIFLSSQHLYRSNEGLNRMQENARVAFELMSRDIRAAGGSACSNASVVEGAGAEVERYRDAAVTGTSDSLRIVSGEDTAYKVVGSTSSSVTLDSAELPQAGDAFEVDDFLLLCNARKTHIVKATSVAGMTVGFAALAGGYVPTSDEYAPPSAVVLARLRDVQWSVRDNGRGGSSLYVSRMGAAPEEVAEGVRDLAFTYLRADANQYVAAPADWRDVTAVRISMTLQGQGQDGAVLTRSVTNVVNMRGRTL